MNEATAIHLAVATDEAFAMPVGVMLASLAARVDPTRRHVTYALGDRLSPETWMRLTASVPSKRCERHRIALNSLDLVQRGFSTRRHGHLRRVVYLRLLLPDFLPNHLDKVLYLDGDLLVREDIASRWDTEIATVDLAAGPDRALSGGLLLAKRPPRTR